MQNNKTKLFQLLNVMMEKIDVVVENFVQNYQEAENPLRLVLNYQTNMILN